MTTRFRSLGSCLLVAMLCSGAPGDDKQPDKNREPVEKLFAALSRAIDARDTKAIADQFTPGGEFIDAEDNVFHGRDAITREFAVLFEINPRHAIKLSAEDIREISPGLLSVDGAAVFPRSDDAEELTVDFTAVVVRQADGRWLFASLRSDGESNIRTPHEHLKRLEWLIGEWVDESSESTMHTNCRWSDDGNFILTDFMIHVAGRKVMNGTQRIAWDGSLEKFRSWVFDSEGGHAEGIWTEMEDRWVVKSNGVRPDGDTGSAMHIYRPAGADAYVFTVTNRIVGDEPQPDFTATVVRKPPEPDAAPKAAPAASGKK